MAEKAVWDDAHLKKLIEILREEVEKGNRPLGYLNKKGWANVLEKWEARTGKKYPKDKFKNKWDAIKNEYTWFMELKNEATGLGWDDAKRTVDCSKEWWDEHIKRCQESTGNKCNHMKFKKQGPKHLEDLHIIFDKVHVTGASASCAGDISSDESSDDNAVPFEKPDDSAEMKLASSKKPKPSKKRKQPSNANEEKEEKCPFLRLYKQTCEKIETGVEKITSSVEASSAPLTNHVPTISEVMKMVKECGVKEKTALMHTTLTLIVKPEFRGIFNVLETEEGRFDFLEREHEKEMLKHV
ncbi:L10-interacting MYB domain-containing protein-like [Triticum dicoccoides]|uniref:L10-interacting MYB domain-containing protein-like n=1 Tax=Triticum dicoccoides TaxID=85692 RepID=UPI00188FB188|nr:L10-interacting MYB domain-containing protein-like [Triticum dicoccoides]